MFCDNMILPHEEKCNLCDELVSNMLKPAVTISDALESLRITDFHNENTSSTNPEVTEEPHEMLVSNSDKSYSLMWVEPETGTPEPLCDLAEINSARDDHVNIIDFVNNDLKPSPVLTNNHDKWQCNACSYDRNSFNREICEICFSNREEFGSWMCERCTCINKMCEYECAACGVENKSIITSINNSNKEKQTFQYVRDDQQSFYGNGTRKKKMTFKKKNNFSVVRNIGNQLNNKNKQRENLFRFEYAPIFNDTKTGSDTSRKQMISIFKNQKGNETHNESTSSTNAEVTVCPNGRLLANRDKSYSSMSVQPKTGTPEPLCHRAESISAGDGNENIIDFVNNDLKPSPVLTNNHDKWQCNACSYDHNSFNSENCEVCFGDREEFGSWMCERCTCINKMCEYECAACGVENKSIITSINNSNKESQTFQYVRDDQQKFDGNGIRKNKMAFKKENNFCVVKNIGNQLNNKNKQRENLFGLEYAPLFNDTKTGSDTSRKQMKSILKNQKSNEEPESGENFENIKICWNENCREPMDPSIAFCKYCRLSKYGNYEHTKFQKIRIKEIWVCRSCHKYNDLNIEKCRTCKTYKN